MHQWKIGVCTPPENARAAREAGFDYIEPALAPIAAMTDDQFARTVDTLGGAGIPVEAVNVFLPGTLRLTGPAVDWSAIETYVRGAIPRAAKLGARVLVFGSGAARRCPEGFPADAAIAQIEDFLRLCGRVAEPLGVCVVIEPLNAKECNAIHTVAEAVAIARRVAHPAVCALGDTYHMALEGEPFRTLTDAGALLRHVHVANPAGRVYPAPDDGCDWDGLFAALAAASYTARVSVEGGTSDFARDAVLALETLHGAAARTVQALR